MAQNSSHDAVNAVNEVNPAATRRHDLDAIRGLGALLVAIAHCLLVFSPWTVLPVAMSQHKVFSELAWFLNPWLMPMFMLLAGASAWFALRKRSDVRYLRERSSLLVMLLVGLVTFIVPSVYLTRVTAGEFHGSLPAFYLKFFSGIYPAGNFTFLHLWFLAYLAVYAVVTLPLFRFLQSAPGRVLSDRLAALSGRRGGILLMALPLVVFQVGFAGRFPMVEYPVFVNDGFRVFTLLYFFVCGYLFVSDERYTRAIAGQWRLALAVALATSAYMAVLAWPDTFDPRQDLPLQYSWHYVVYHASFILCGWSWTVVALALGKRFLAMPSPALAYLGRASLVVYLVHPVFWLAGTLAVSTLGLPALVGFPALAAFDIAASLGTYEALRRLPQARQAASAAAASLETALANAIFELNGLAVIRARQQR